MYRRLCAQVEDALFFFCLIGRLDAGRRDEAGCSKGINIRSDWSESDGMIIGELHKQYKGD